MPDKSVYAAAGKVNFVSAQVDPRLGTIQMRAEFSNDKNVLLPGQYVGVHLLGQSISEAVTVPAGCLMQSAKGRFVYVLNAENKAQINPVEVGEILGPKAILSSGLKAGDRVVIDNLQKVRPGAVVIPRGETAPAK
jgi:membrane fusion protein (multidrug efflux system)